MSKQSVKNKSYAFVVRPDEPANNIQPEMANPNQVPPMDVQ